MLYYYDPNLLDRLLVTETFEGIETWDLYLPRRHLRVVAVAQAAVRICEDSNRSTKKEDQMISY
jgi:hypothetical protein